MATTCCCRAPRDRARPRLAERIPTILPDLDAEESLELTAIHSLAGVLDPSRGHAAPPAVRRARTTTPARPASWAAAAARSDPASSAARTAESCSSTSSRLFRADVIEALREPLENGEITVARAEELVTLPARGMVVLAANPCPVRRLPRRRRSQPVLVPRHGAPRLPPQGHRAGHRPHRHHPPGRSGAPARAPRPPRRARDLRDRARARRAGPAAPGASATAGAPGG